MESLWQAGISFIIWLQGLGAWLETPMKLFSFLGTEEFFLMFLPIVYWGVDSNAGLRIGAIMLITNGINDALKLAFHGPRPYWLSTQVKAFSAETSFGVPSSHAQIAVGVWGVAASLVKRKWMWAVAIFIMLMIGISRLYLAVHFPHDVLLGWMLGVLGLWAFLRLWDTVAAWAGKKPLGQQVSLAFALSMAMLAMGTIAFGSLQNWVMPAAWMENVRLAGLDVLPAPVTLNTTITSSAVLFGMLAGVAWTNSRGGFVADGRFGRRILRLLVGFLGILVFYLGLKVIFPHQEEFISYMLRYLRFMLVGLWVSAGAPWLFLKLNLARSSASD